MLSRTQDQFSGMQQLRPLGDTMSAFLDVGVGRYRFENSNPFIHVQVAAPLVPSEDTQLEIALLHADKGQPFTLWAVLLEPTYIEADMNPELMVGRLPPVHRQFLQLAYRVSGGPLLSGTITAFLHPLAAEETPAPSPANPKFVYHPSGFSFPAGYNRPGIPMDGLSPTPPSQPAGPYF